MNTARQAPARAPDGADGPTIALSINGREERVPAVTLAELLAARGVPEGGRGFAVARNRDVVPKALWPTTRLVDGDRIEIIRPIMGG